MPFPLDPNHSSMCGHRGSPLHLPENSLAAFEAAIAEGAEFVEFDVRLAACGAPMVFHDRTLKRMAGRDARLDNFTARELKGIHIGHHQHVPTLDEVIDVCRGHVNLAVEIKEHRALEATVRTLAKHGVASEVLVMSFDFATVRGLGRYGAGLHAGMLMGHQTMDVLVRLREAFPLVDVIRCGASFLSIHHSLHHRALARLCRQMNVPVGTWTVNEADEIQRMLELGVGLIITDFPALGVTLRERRA